MLKEYYKDKVDLDNEKFNDIPTPQGSEKQEEHVMPSLEKKVRKSKNNIEENLNESKTDLIKHNDHFPSTDKLQYS